MNKKIVTLTVCVVALSGCAGSASHKVVSSHTSGDEALSCAQIDAEIVKAQVIINDVNKDKDDVSGADVVDGILWFPFNLIAKSENYKNALDAADRRIQRLHTLKSENNCKVASKSKRDADVMNLSAELNELSNLYKSGALTEQEYKEAKQKLLNDG